MFTLVVMGALDVFHSCPYIFLNYAYGAGHGFFYPPLFGSVYLVHKISNDYTIDVDIVAPDGVGGYRGVGEAIVDLISYGNLLVTLDFVVLSSVSFLDRPLFRTAALVVYGLMFGSSSHSPSMASFHSGVDCSTSGSRRPTRCASSSKR